MALQLSERLIQDARFAGYAWADEVSQQQPRLSREFPLSVESAVDRVNVSVTGEGERMALAYEMLDWAKKRWSALREDQKPAAG